jgi:hypothetical protein
MVGVTVQSCLELIPESKRDIECDFVLQDCDGLQQGPSEGGGTSRQQSLHLSRGILLTYSSFTVAYLNQYGSVVDP